MAIHGWSCPDCGAPGLVVHGYVAFEQRRCVLKDAAGTTVQTLSIATVVRPVEIDGYRYVGTENGELVYVRTVPVPPGAGEGH